MDTIKKTYKVYLAWDYEFEEKKINEMSKSGWQLIDAGLFSHTYKREQGNYVYRIDFNNAVNRNLEEGSRYIEIYEEMGWKHIASTFNGWQYFRKEVTDEGTEEDYVLYNDNESLKQALTRWIRIARILQISFTCFTINAFTSFLRHRSMFFLLTFILEIMAFLLMEGGIIMMKKKKVNTLVIDDFTRKLSYICFYSFFAIAIFTLISPLAFF